MFIGRRLVIVFDKKMVLLHEGGLTQAESDLLTQLVKSFKRNNYRYNEALNFLASQVKDELAYEEHDISRHHDELLDRVKIEISDRRKQRVPNLSSADINNIILQLDKTLRV